MQSSSDTLHSCCAKCEEYFNLIASYSAVPATNARQEHMVFHNIEDLALSAANGCHLCNLIIVELGPEDVQRLRQELILRPESRRDQIRALVLGYEYQSVRPTLRFEEPIWEEDGTTINASTLCELRYLPLKNEHDASQSYYSASLSSLTLSGRLTKAVQPSTASWETFNDIHRWLRLCEKVHSRCVERRHKRIGQLPTRIVYVGAFQADSLVYVQDTKGIAHNARYITLSHSWGGSVPCRLLESNHSSYAAGVHTSALPKTFRDAIALTKALGLDYIWIDSLCIVQDSRDDWERECVLMSDIYNGSFLNVAANAASDANGGLFRDRSALQVTPFRKRMCYQPFRWIHKPFVFFPQSWGPDILKTAPLSKRAWTVQERLLAPRTVHFLHHKVIWECPSLRESETDDTGEIETMASSASYGFRNWAVPWSHDHIHSHREEAYLCKWSDAVGLYTRGDLTFESDKLVAISGLAKYVKEMWHNDSIEYLAGLWSYQLEWSLVWSVLSGGVRPASYRSPTWSWASIDGPVFIPYFHAEQRREMLITILKAQTEARDDPFGPVDGGSIQIKGPLCRTQMDYPDSSQSSRTNISLKLASSGLSLDFDELYFDDSQFVHSTSPSTTLFLLGVSKWHDPSLLPIDGLVLQLTGLAKGQYSRVGSFSFSDWWPSNSPEELSSNSYAMIEKALTSMDLDAQCFEDEDRENSVYTITIV